MPLRSGEFFGLAITARRAYDWHRPPNTPSEPIQGMNGSIAAALRGTGCSVPDRVVPNDWFTHYVETSDEWIRTRTGIRERRFVGPSETAGTLATTASRQALAAAGLTADHLD